MPQVSTVGSLCLKLLLTESIYSTILAEDKFCRPPKGMIIKHQRVFRHRLQQNLRPRPIEEMEQLVVLSGYDAPAEEFRKIFYVGDGKHYLYQLPKGESKRPKDRDAALAIREHNKNVWGKQVDVSGAVYSKISWKPRTHLPGAEQMTTLWPVDTMARSPSNLTNGATVRLGSRCC